MANHLTGRKALDEELNSLYNKLMKLGTLAEDAINKAIWALKKSDLSLAEEVMRGDEELDQITQSINEQALEIIARFQPVAMDLRMIASILHMSVDLERIGDLGVSIAKIAKALSKEKLIKPLIDIPRMGEKIREMIDLALKAFVNKNPEEAKKICALDDEIDDLDKQIFRELVVLMMENPRNIEQAMQLILVSRALERAGDHVTNLCEHTVYMCTGNFIRASSYRRRIERSEEEEKRD
ncbi:phosphate signaling complex protein PhoU [Thermovirga lienii]|jgi:phosphate transport system protein|uniref:phosphate signaling complex protein PhoU n=1 Tax=Thermovirga lienii TaxID=336261 RepID=UPI000EBC38D8|nr:phosphate transport system regulatory protein PhoU [Thermovirga lienii]